MPASWHDLRSLVECGLLLLTQNDDFFLLDIVGISWWCYCRMDIVARSSIPRSVQCRCLSASIHAWIVLCRFYVCRFWRIVCGFCIYCIHAEKDWVRFKGRHYPLQVDNVCISGLMVACSPVDADICSWYSCLNGGPVCFALSLAHAKVRSALPK